MKTAMRMGTPKWPIETRVSVSIDLAFHFGASAELAGPIRSLIFCKFFGGLLDTLVASDREKEGT